MYAEVFTKEQMLRISETVSEGIKEITVDVHGLTGIEAIRFVRNIIALNFRSDIKLHVIHGYNGGTVIKQALYTNKLSNRDCRISSCFWNPGQTILNVA